ncbi:putative mitochondrial enoyl reductase protein [Botryosphaeria dothidea]|uniref:Mitochondrial enoyl reductase protein n=1 Tax=Botryosphaeria dothidea TaxID=55169 RepID=A0A8H4J302_9PEZI|nr:putative mitochondrial enoyl reductase protein [Botryosphaeria dothidea]
MASYDDPYRHTCLVPYVDAATAPPAVAEKINVLPFRRNVFLLLAHARGPFPHLMGLLSSYFNGQLRTVQLLEWQLVVLRVATTLQAKYVQDVNLPVAELYEMGEEKLAAIRSQSADSVRKGDPGPWSPRERLILRVVDEQLATYTNEPATIEEALRVLSVEELVEVLIIVGTYSLLARITRGLKIDDDQPIRPPGLFEGLRKSVTPTVPRE